MENIVIAAIDALAQLRGVSPEAIKQEIREGRDDTKAEIFALSAAAAAIAQ